MKGFRRATLLAVFAAALLAAGVGSAGERRVDALTELVPGASAAAPLASPLGQASARSPRRANRGSAPRSLLGTGFGDLLYQSGDSRSATAFDQTVAVNGKVVRLSANWAAIAPPEPGPGFDAQNPSSPGYSWAGLDGAVQQASQHGLRTVILVSTAPSWAEGDDRPADAAPGTWKPKPRDVRDFGLAIARRYSGSTPGVPRVRDFQLWAEPNLEGNLTPIWTGGNGKRPAAPVHYKAMLNAFYKGVKSVRRNNNVVTAGTAPYGADPGVLNMRPLQFWRNVLCLRDNRQLTPRKRCRPARFDVLAHHPINTSGGPSRSAIHADDVSTPDLHNLVDVLRAAERAKTVRPRGHRPVWATELWWESDPPDPYEANPGVRRHARWYAQSLYSLWRQGASMVVFLQVRDAPYDGTPGRFTENFQTGTHFADGKPKPAARAVAFPFVVDRQSRKEARIWGIAPKSGRIKVIQKGRGKRRVAAGTVNGGRVFTTKVRLPRGSGKHRVRAVMRGERSLSFTLK